MDNKENKEQNIEKKDLLEWINIHKKKLIFIGVSIPVLIALVLAVENKSSLVKLWSELKEEIKRADLYSSKWFENATKDELNVEREKVRQAYCSASNSFKEACDLQCLLRRFDNELSKRAWGDEKPSPPSFHRENGWYLLNDD